MTPFKTQNRVTSPFGWRTIFDKREFHRGVDIVPTTRSGEMLPESAWLIREVTGGMVLRTAADQWRGNYVDVQTAPGTFERYQHLARADVGVGQAVAQGTVIGLAGSTGQSTGRHLHFGVYQGGSAEANAVIPAPWVGFANACGTYPGNDMMENAPETPELEPVTGKQLTVTGENCEYFPAMSTEYPIAKLAKDTVYDVTMLAPDSTTLSVGDVTVSGPWCK